MIFQCGQRGQFIREKKIIKNEVYMSLKALIQLQYQKIYRCSKNTYNYMMTASVAEFSLAF